MNKSNDFDNILNECLERTLHQGETVEQCLRAFPQHAAELKPMLEMALATRKASAIQPNSDFRARARQEFLAALAQSAAKKKQPVSIWSRQPRWAMSLAVILLVLLAGAGTVGAAANSLPNQFLYPVKLATEQAQIALTPSKLGKAEVYARLASRRAAEIAAMARQNKPDQVILTASRLDGYLTKIADLSGTGVTFEAASIPAAEESPAPSLGGGSPTPPMSTLPAETPVAAVPQITAVATPAPESLAPSDAKRAQELPSPTPAIVPPQAPMTTLAGKPSLDQRAKLRAKLVQDAANELERLQALLPTVPESARPALEQAIAISQSGYQRAIEALE